VTAVLELVKAGAVSVYPVTVGVVRVLFVNVSEPVRVAKVPVVGNVTVVVPVAVRVVLYAPLVTNVDPSARVSVADVAGAVKATLLTLVAVATPMVGVVSVGLVASTLLPVPVFVTDTTFLLASSARAVDAVSAEIVAVPPMLIVLPVPTFNPTDVPDPAAAKIASTESKSVLILVPQVSVLAPTSGLVSNRFVVVVSAI